MKEKEKISKLEAASRQVKEAIQLFFERRDAVSIFTIIGAAHRLLTDLIVKEGKVNLLTNSPYIRGEKRKEWRELIRAPINFLKHADFDPESYLELDKGLIPYYIIDCVTMLGQLKGKQTYSDAVFFAWYALMYPDHLIESPWKDGSIEEVRNSLSPHDFEKWEKVLSFDKIISHWHRVIGPLLK